MRILGLTITTVLMIFFAFMFLAERLETQRLLEKLEIQELDCSIAQMRSKKK